ncbi:unnamed protein product [Amoebophrya sp. A120]|nr:unnamed protein product [Amoebophrya sp. A120]|eukprot:GSA120T00012825001.1
MGNEVSRGDQGYDEEEPGFRDRLRGWKNRILKRTLTPTEPSTAIRLTKLRQSKPECYLARTNFLLPKLANLRVIKAPVTRDWQLHRKRTLGTGFSGAVVLAEHKVTGQRAAVKGFAKQKLATDERRLEMLREEINVYLSLDHPNVCKLLYAYEDRYHLWLVMELCAEELYDRLCNLGVFTEEEAAHALSQMFLAVNYLHSYNIVHRDLKLENWMYSLPSTVVPAPSQQQQQRTSSRASGAGGTSSSCAGNSCSISTPAGGSADGTTSGTATNSTHKSTSGNSSATSNPPRRSNSGKPPPAPSTTSTTNHNSTSKQQNSSTSSSSSASSPSSSSTEHLKLIDFGFSKRVRSAGDILELPCGTLHYASPDVLRRSYNRKCDTWSMGVIAFMLLTGSPPFTGSSNQSVIEKIRSGRVRFNTRWQKLSRTAQNFVLCLLDVDPERRLSGEAALQHDFLRPYFHRQSVTAMQGRLHGVLDNLRKFASGSRLMRAGLLMLAYRLSSEDTADLMELFFVMDRSGRGTLRIHDFAELLRRLEPNIATSEIRELFTAIATDTPGKVREVFYSQFVAAMLQRHCCLPQRHGEQLKQIFDTLAYKQDGQLSNEQLRDVLLHDAEGMIAEADLTGKGTIDYQEFLAVVCQQNKSLNRISQTRISSISTMASLTVQQTSTEKVGSPGEVDEDASTTAGSASGSSSPAEEIASEATGSPSSEEASTSSCSGHRAQPDVQDPRRTDGGSQSSSRPSGGRGEQDDAENVNNSLEQEGDRSSSISWSDLMRVSAFARVSEFENGRASSSSSSSDPFGDQAIVARSSSQESCITTAFEETSHNSLGGTRNNMPAVRATSTGSSGRETTSCNRKSDMRHSLAPVPEDSADESSSGPLAGAGEKNLRRGISETVLPESRSSTRRTTRVTTSRPSKELQRGETWQEDRISPTDDEEEDDEEDARSRLDTSREAADQPDAGPATSNNKHRDSQQSCATYHFRPTTRFSAYSSTASCSQQALAKNPFETEELAARLSALVQRISSSSSQGQGSASSSSAAQSVNKTQQEDSSTSVDTDRLIASLGAGPTETGMCFSAVVDDSSHGKSSSSTTARAPQWTAKRPSKTEADHHSTSTTDRRSVREDGVEDERHQDDTVYPPRDDEDDDVYPPREMIGEHQQEQQHGSCASSSSSCNRSSITTTLHQSSNLPNAGGDQTTSRKHHQHHDYGGAAGGSTNATGSSATSTATSSAPPRATLPSPTCTFRSSPLSESRGTRATSPACATTPDDESNQQRTPNPYRKYRRVASLVLQFQPTSSASSAVVPEGSCSGAPVAPAAATTSSSARQSRAGGASISPADIVLDLGVVDVPAADEKRASVGAQPLSLPPVPPQPDDSSLSKGISGIAPAGGPSSRRSSKASTVVGSSRKSTGNKISTTALLPRQRSGSVPSRGIGIVSVPCRRSMYEAGHPSVADDNVDEFNGALGEEEGQ